MSDGFNNKADETSDNVRSLSVKKWPHLKSGDYFDYFLSCPLQYFLFLSRGTIYSIRNSTDKQTEEETQQRKGKETTTVNNSLL